MYELDIKPTADRIFRKLARKNPHRLGMIHKKLQEIREHPEHAYKFMRAPLQMFNRVHIDSSFVLIFQVHHAEQMVELWYFDHHDRVYAWRPPDAIR